MGAGAVAVPPLIFTFFPATRRRSPHKGKISEGSGLQGPAGAVVPLSLIHI